MLGQQFYHETIRKIIVAFGTTFNNVQLVRKDSSGNITQSMKVPLAYGPREKFLVRLRSDADLSSKVAVTLPRIGFEIQNLTYDATRKLNRVQKFKKVNAGNNTRSIDTQYMPVPYNLDVVLYILAKQSDDALQIVEQILPYFHEDSYEGDFEQRRALIYTMNFTCKFYLYGPVTSSNIIRTVQADQFADLPDKSPKREQRLTVTPNPSSADADDDFGFNETSSFFTDAKNFNPVTGEDE